MYTTQSFRLAEHVRACEINGSAVLLDLQRNKYLMLPQAETSALSRILHDWPIAKNGIDVPEDEARNFALELFAAGLISPHDGKPLPRRHAADLNRALVASEDETEAHKPVTVGHCLNFVAACAHAKLALARHSLGKLALEVLRNRDSIASATAGRSKQPLLELVDIFGRLRPYAFTARNHCLFHSLALLAFLAQYDIVPSWVIGVKLNPWAAHSWLESGEVILDSTPEKVTEYSPIFHCLRLRQCSTLWSCYGTHRARRSAMSQAFWVGDLGRPATTGHRCALIPDCTRGSCMMRTPE